jgi:SAM-dependent methyltransferase
MTVSAPVAELANRVPAHLQGHINLLRERVFEATRYQPQFDLLLSDLLDLSASAKPDEVVVSIERMLLYGKNIISPLFSHLRYVSLDSSPASAEARGAYNARLVEDVRFIEAKCESRRCNPNILAFEDRQADLVLIPNLVHHVEDQQGMWSEVRRILKPSGQLYVFEPVLREVHQDPDDFLRYTPSGLSKLLEKLGFKIELVRTTGGPFTAIAYCWNQALQYIKEDERSRWSDWFASHYEELVDLETRFPKNLVRNFTSFPTAFSLLASKE